MKRQCAAYSVSRFGAMDGLCGCGVFGVFGSYLKSTVLVGSEMHFRVVLQALGGRANECWFSSII